MGKVVIWQILAKERRILNAKPNEPGDRLANGQGSTTGSHVTVVLDTCLCAD